MSISVSGNDIQFDGTVRVVNGANPESGVAYLILTPKGGVGSLPFLAQGLPGKPPVFDSITMESVDPGTPLPTPNPEVTMVSPGGDGQASHYTLKFYQHKGDKGDTGTVAISAAEDLSAAPGAGTDGYTLRYDHGTQKWVLTALWTGNQYVPGSISATAYTNTSPRVLGQIEVPPQPHPYRANAFAQTEVTGSASTRVDLVVRVGDPSTGARVGFSKGKVGPNPPVNVLIPAPPAGESVPGSYGVVPAGEARTFYLIAEQKAATDGSWSTPAAPDTTFYLDVRPLA